jgi:hypothetical protein
MAMEANAHPAIFGHEDLNGRLANRNPLKP